MKKVLIAASLALWAGSSHAATLGFDIIAQGSRTEVRNFSTGVTTTTGNQISAFGLNGSGTVLLSETLYNGTSPRTDQFLTIAGGTTSVFAVSDSTGPNGVGAGIRIGASAFTEDGSILGTTFNTNLGTRFHGSTAQGGVITTLATDLQVIGSQEIRASGLARETATGSVFGASVRPVGGTGNTFAGSALLTEDNGTLAVLAQAGTALNGRSDVQIGFPDSFVMDANRSGQIVFEARLQGSGVDFSTYPGSGFPIGNTNGLILSGPGGLDLIVEGGTAAPDGLGVFSQFFGKPAINESGAILFRARIYDPVSQTFQSALFLRQPNGDLQTIAKQGDPVPGSTTGATISFPSEIALADDGTILFTASTSGRETVAIRIKNGIAHTLFKTGDQLGLGNGQFADLTFINVSRDLIRTGDDFILNAISRKPSVVDVSDPNNVTRTEVTDSYVLRSTLVEVDPDAVVPLPASVLLLMGGLGALGATRIARRGRGDRAA